MKKIPLTQGQFAMVDDEDYEYLMQWKWYAQKCRGAWRAVRTPLLTTGKQVMIYMHRALLCPAKGFEVDHIDHDGLNNQRANLRVCTHAENLRNQVKQLGTLSRFKGTYRHFNRWVARIAVTVNGKETQIHLGTFPSETDAARAYDSGAVERFGEFACLNFPEEHPRRIASTT